MDPQKVKQLKQPAPVTTVINEDVPEYRSVMVGPPKGLTDTTTCGGLPSRPFPKSFASMKPLQKRKPQLVRSNSSSSHEKKFSLTRVPLLTSGPSVVDVVEPPPPSRWQVQEHELKELPSTYNLVRTNVYIKFSNPQQVADTICNTLKSLSIITIIDDDNERDAVFEGEHNILLAETQYGMKLAIRLFKSYDHENNKMIVVEIKRTFGCSLEFRDTAKAILRSVKKIDSSSLMMKRKTPSSSSFTIPTFVAKRSIRDRHKCIEDEVNRCCRVLLTTSSSNTKIDSRLLSLESMERMTSKKNSNNNDTDTTTATTCNTVAARCILGHCDCLCRLIIDDEQNEEEVEAPSASRSSSSHNHHHSFSSIRNGSASSSNSLSLSSSSSDLLRRKVLTVLANSFDAISGSTEEEFEMILSKNENGTSDLIKSRSFLSVLLKCIHNASVRPHDAYQAVRCLRYLVTITSTQEQVSALIHKMNGLDVLMQHNGFVHCHHSGLERESDFLLAQLEHKKKKHHHPLVC